MTIRFLAPLFLLVLATPATTQTIRVQSGDHPSFTRLVLQIGTDRDWNLQQNDAEQWQVTLSPDVEAFDTSRSFDLIQRTRLQDLSSDGALVLDLACSCDVTASRYDGQYLVIDIADPDPNAPPSVTEAEEAVDHRLAEAAEAARNAAASLPDLTSLLTSPSSLPEIAGARAVDPIIPIEEDVGDTAPPDTPNPRLAEAAEIMAEQLARAAASGLLDTSLNQPFAVADPVEEPVAAADVEAEVPEQPQPTPVDEESESEPATSDEVPVRAETAFDEAIRMQLTVLNPRIPGACRGDAFDARDWASGAGFDQGLGALRTELFDDRDVLTEDAAMALARHYLHFGFGAEARFWLEQLPDPPAHYLHVAALVDGADAAPFPSVETPSLCSQGELLWRYFGGSVTVDLLDENVATIQRAFMDLPPDLRDNVGPRLAARLIDDGHTPAAINVRDALHRGGRIDGGLLTALDLSLGIETENNTSETRAALTEALRDDGANPVILMTEALAFDRRTGTLPSPSRITAAEALIREVGTGAETDRLWQEILLAHAAIGDIDQALVMLGDTVRGSEARAAALSELIQERVSVSDTAALVILAYTYGPQWRPEGSADGRAQVQAIAALRAEGLYEAANILRDVRRPLILPAPDAAPPTPEDEAADAWEARDWARLMSVSTGPHAAIAARMTELGAPQEEASTEPLFASDLEALSDTLVDSRALRDTVAALLDQPTPP